MSPMSESELGAVAGERSVEPSSPASAIDDPNAVYALGSSSGESARLQRQAEELLPDSAVLVDRVGLRPGDGAIDVGCGPRGVVDLLAERVTPGGRVVGLDADPAHVAMACEFVASRGLSDVEVVCGDARHTDLESGSFDLVHARTLLITVPQPAEVLREMVRLARPGGGWLALSQTPRPRSATRHIPHSIGCARSSRSRSHATAPTHTSADGWLSSIAKRDSRT